MPSELNTTVSMTACLFDGYSSLINEMPRTWEALNPVTRMIAAVAGRSTRKTRAINHPRPIHMMLADISSKVIFPWFHLKSACVRVNRIIAGKVTLVINVEHIWPYSSLSKPMRLNQATPNINNSSTKIDESALNWVSIAVRRQI